MRAFILSLAVLFAPPAFAKSPAVTAERAPATSRNHAQDVHYSVAETEIGLLLDDPAAKAVIDRHIPGLTTSEQVGLMGGLTLKDLQQFIPSVMTDAKLAAIQGDFETF